MRFFSLRRDRFEKIFLQFGEMVFDKYFQGKNVLVTGAGRGFGRALAIALYGSGAKVYALSRSLDTLESLKAELPNIIPICVDLSDWDATRKALEPLERMDCVVNNAGICETCPFMDITQDLFDKIASINLKAIINVSQITAAKMIEEGRPGRIINISSILGKQGAALFGVYATLKAGLDMLTYVMAIELGPHKITVNSINPGLVDTPLVSRIDPVVATSLKDTISGRAPGGEAWTPIADVVNTILFVASGIAPTVNGVSLPVDGGFLIG